MLSYAAYLRIYEPVTAFHEPNRSRWMAYADSPGRPRRRDSLLAEQAEALRRAIAAPQIVVPGQEIEHAYVRRADGVTYICPWQTRLLRAGLRPDAVGGWKPAIWRWASRYRTSRYRASRCWAPRCRAIEHRVPR